MTLPIDAVLPDLLDALRREGQAVLQAPPGAGKTTRVPLAIMQAELVQGRIVMLEPRRLAARAAAERMADALGEAVGERVGYRIRGEAKVSDATRIEVVTEGVLTRRLQSDPGLDGVGAVIFDEFHERSLNADLGLALCLEVRGALREDLVILPMSATLEAGPVAGLMGGAPVITAEGRAFPVDVRHLDTPVPKGKRFEEAMAELIAHALTQTDGSILAFLPGEGEIRGVARRLSVPTDTEIRPLFGALPFADQRAAIAPCRAGARKVVLATSIAETSLTIEGIACVVDGGKSRRARFDPASGMSRLVTERVTRAEATQRTGRAGRLGPGICYRLWTKGQEGSLASHPPAEIEAADLAGLALDLALWGARDAADLPFLTAPPAPALAEARALLADLGALGAEGGLTEHGRAMARLPLHPRLAHMLLVAGRSAAPLAALLSERDPLKGAGVDLKARLRAVRGERVAAEVLTGPLRRIREETKRLSKLTPKGDDLPPEEAAALAYPDRIGLRRPGDAPRWLLSGGKGAAMEAGDPLAGTRLLVATDLGGDTREARIRQAVPIAEASLRRLFADRIEAVDRTYWSVREGRVVAVTQERLWALVLAETKLDADPADVARAALDGVRTIGLPWRPRAARLRDRAELFRAEGGDLPDMSEETLMAEAEEWLLPYLTGVRTAADIRKLDTFDALQARLGWDAMKRMEDQMPPVWETPLGRLVPIDWEGDHPEIEVRVQELFGVTEHPVIGPRRRPLRVTLLSPAGRAVQTTMDLPGFWTSSYADVRKDMRARYPRHPWPEDPRQSDPTLRAKRRT
ncbi:ATP-dependent helicase HrpB [Tropicimonas sp. IMCC34011]|uniref:ATP-dependent helicase HrpB n=1 Tax=Tropicimonas sp. IMCC34011 TaxID=2248759 RepID=UPI000E258D67|nr:ATP-dependent helicase HrpB [Tropicimonas sp. IMCC34011]